MEPKNKNCENLKENEKGFAPQCEGCPNKKICQSNVNELLKTTNKVSQSLSKVKNIILILSGKGGVGKSTVATQLSYSLSAKNLEIGLLDVDICGPSIPQMMGLKNSEIHSSSEGWTPVYKKENLAVMSIGFLLQNQDEAVIWRGPRKNGLILQFLTETNWGKLDFLIIDTPPGTSDEHLSLVSYLSKFDLKGAIIVTTPQEVALADVRKELNFCKKTDIKVMGIVENMSGFVCKHCGEKTEIFGGENEGVKKMSNEFGVPIIGKIPLEMKLMLSGEKGEWIKEESEAKNEMEKVAEFVMKH